MVSATVSRSPWDEGCRDCPFTKYMDAVSIKTNRGWTSETDVKFGEKRGRRIAIGSLGLISDKRVKGRITSFLWISLGKFDP